MIITLNWTAPTDDSFTTVLVYKSTSETGTFSELTSFDAKDSNNDWVTTYTDVDGDKSYWYKIKYSDGTTITDYALINGLYSIKYSCLDYVTGLTGLSFGDVSTSEVPNKKVVLNWIGWAEDYIDKLMGYSFKIENTVEIQNIETSTTYVYLNNKNVYQINHVWTNDNDWLSPTWTELTANTDYNLVNSRFGELRLASAISGDQAIEIDYDYGIGEVPKDVEQLATYLVAKNVIKYIMNNKVTNVGQAITVGAIKISNKISDGVGFLNNINNEIVMLESKVGTLKSWVR